jgi:hypothetical protein
VNQWTMVRMGLGGFSPVRGGLPIPEMTVELTMQVVRLNPMVWFTLRAIRTCLLRFGNVGRAL